MNRRIAAVYAGFAIGGLGLGAIEAGKWLRALSVPHSDPANVSALIRMAVCVPAAMFVLGIALSVFNLIKTADQKEATLVFLKAVIATAAAFLICGALVRLSRVFYLAPLGYIPVFATVLGAGTAIIYYYSVPVVYRSKGSSAGRGTIASLIWVALMFLLKFSSLASSVLLFGKLELNILSVGGFGTFAAVFEPPQLGQFPTLFNDIASGALYGGTTGALMSILLPRCQVSRATLWGLVMGAWVSGVLFEAHSVVVTRIMATAYDPKSACLVSVAAAVMAAIVIALGIVCSLRSFSSQAHRLTALCLAAALLLAGGMYVSNARRGSELYFAALKIRPDNSREYIHYRQDGSWTRTTEAHSDPAKLFLCNRLLREHPDCLYSAQAMYLKAKCQYASWQFDDAILTLESMAKRYGEFRGVSSLLLTNSYLASGNFGKVTSRDRIDPVFDEWCTGSGRLLLGHAYEVTGDGLKARSRYADYIDGLTAAPLGRRGPWSAPSIQYAENRFDKVAARTTEPAFGTVHSRILCDGRPLAGVFVSLVQPHIDAAAPDDTNQFTSALTIPLWFGIGATSFVDGSIAMQNVPYGRYEVVVGFETRCIPSDRVIAASIRSVTVDSTHVRLPDINFVPSIELVRPIGRATTGPEPTLVWKSYPGAAYYSVSVISPISPEASHTAYSAFSGSTCWTRSHIRATSVKVDNSGFSGAVGESEEAKLSRLVIGRNYTWIVLAHDSRGTIISSSERYRHNSEATIVIKADDSKGG